MVLELPWPARELHPNARPHFAVKAKATKAARNLAMWAAKGKEWDAPATGDITLHVRFHPPANRGDTDGMFSACKAYYDGIADALLVNDRRFAFTIQRREVIKGGLVVIELEV